MAFTNYVPPLLNREQSGALPDLVGNLLSGYGGGVKAKYAPQMQEAEIFNKKIGPLASLATTPMFLQNPQFQAALGSLIAKNLNFGGKEFSGMNENGMPTYAEQVNKDVKEGEKIANHLATAGKIRTGISGGAGWLENNFGDVGKHIAKFFSGGKIDSHLAQEENRLKDIFQTLKNNEIQTQRMTPQQAEQTFTKRENETYKQMFKRLKKTNPNLFEQEENSAENNQPENNEPENNESANGTDEATMEQNNEAYSFALDLADQIYQKTGKKVSELKIFRYMLKNPGTINIPTLLTEIGEE